MPISSDICFWFLFFSANLAANSSLFIIWYFYTKCNLMSSKIFMTKEEKLEVGQRIKDFLEYEGYKPVDAAKEFSPQVGISVEDAQVRISRITAGRIGRSEKFLIYLYLKFRANIGFLLTGKGPRKIKSIE